eukprot:TRINITY_DN1284_c0_g1_i2.p1 TRINITY_DN1284_c0_g1~~TRINITY_DN1284_c0_g1_i2.p1  ORF type:complete len:737 (-),score=108.48 TRINITY_DN1284_c0_g1_i2:5070-7280(-)
MRLTPSLAGARVADPGDPSCVAFAAPLPKLITFSPAPPLTSAPCANGAPLEARCGASTKARLLARIWRPVASVPPCSVLWLRSGQLRLCDNPAAMAASTANGFVIALVTLPSTPLSPLVSSAVSELARLLRRAHRPLLVRVANDQDTAATNVTRTLRAGTLYTILPSVRARRMLRAAGVKLSAFASPRRLCEAPTVWPPPPPAATSLHSDISFDPSATPAGETLARSCLAHMLTQSNITLQTLLARFRPHLQIGTLTELRIRMQFRLSRTPLSRVLTNSWHNRISSALSAFFALLRPPPALAAFSIAAYDVNGGDRRGVEWDEATQSFVLKEWEHQQTERQMLPKQRLREFLRRRRNFFHRAFFPEDVTPDYYSFTAWRFAQRCFSATVGVFGTSSLLFALGIRSGRIGQAAVISWVLKDGLGRVGKMVWAGSMGKDFDVDPKRWRFRSALLYVFGSGLEIVTQIFPASFLLFATAANTMKQVSMLTASATRNAMYRSFGERSQNIANITAKGEAQIVVADLIGMGTGIQLSKVVTSKAHVLATYAVLTVMDIFGIYMELRQVVFRTLNAERSSIVLNYYVRNGECLSPSQVSLKERIFLKEKYKSRVRLSSIAKAAKNPDELQLLLTVFRREHFIVTLPRASDGGACRLVLRKDASNEDVLRAMLTAEYVHQAVEKKNGKKPTLSREDKESILRNARKYAKRTFPSFTSSAKEAGWNTDNLLFSTMKRRGFWRHK